MSRIALSKLPSKAPLSPIKTLVSVARSTSSNWVPQEKETHTGQVNCRALVQLKINSKNLDFSSRNGLQTITDYPDL